MNHVTSLTPQDIITFMEAELIVGAIAFASFLVASYLSSKFIQKLFARYSKKMRSQLDIQLDSVNLCVSQISGTLGLAIALSSGNTLLDGLLPASALHYALDCLHFSAMDTVINLSTSYYAGFGPYLSGITAALSIAAAYTALILATAKPMQDPQESATGISVGNDGIFITAPLLAESMDD